MKITRILILPLIILMAILPFLLTENKLSTDITVLLPADKWVAAHMDFLRNSQISSISAISISAESEELAAKIPEYTENFSKKIADKPSVKEVFFKISPETLTGIVAFLCPRVPQILTNNDLKTIRCNIEPHQVKQLLKKHYETLLRPGGLFQQKMISADPLNLYRLVIDKIQKIGKDSGFKFVVHDNGLWSADGKHFLMLVYTNVPVTDAAEGEKYLAMLENNLKKSLPPSGYSYNIMSGHKHSIENRHLLQRDITVTLIIAAIGFLLLFALFFKDWRAIFVFLIPILGMLCAVGLTWLFFSGPSAIILGLGATVIGIALDYGIHVFVSAKHSTESDSSIKKLARPLIFSALTTLGVFWAFFFSDTPGYHQLAFASTCGIAVSLLLSLACLPLILPQKQGSTKTESTRILHYSFPHFKLPKARLISAIWLFFVLLSLFSIFMIEFEPDIRKMDGSGAKIRSEEEAFRKIWGKNSQAAITVIRPNLESAMECQDRIAKFAEENKIENFQSLSEIWPSKKTRQENLNAWKKFWNNGNSEKFQQSLVKYGRKYEFNDNAFEPFFKNLNKQDINDEFTRTPGFSLFSRKFINYKDGKVRVNAFCADNQKEVNKLKDFTTSIPGCDVISPGYFGTYISNKILDDALYIAIIALILVLFLAWLCLRKPYNTLLALVPVISSSLSIIPIYAICSWKINAIVLVAMIVVTGLAIDYGIFAVTSLKNNNPEFAENAFTALTISMLSTIVGSGALLWASHPALNSVGKVITIGVFAGYLSAIFIVPAAWRLTQKEKK
jgi:predicted exporter